MLLDTRAVGSPKAQHNYTSFATPIDYDCKKRLKIETIA